MSFISRIKQQIRLLSQPIRHAILAGFYDENKIIEYYRKQGAQIGENCRIDTRTPWYDAHLISIGNHVFISRSVLFHTHDGATWIIQEENPKIRITGKIVIEDNCMIGTYCQIFLNTRIGNNSIVGAGSVVINDVPPNSIVMGVPARVIGSTLKYREKHLAMYNDSVASKKQDSADLPTAQDSKDASSSK
jgi:acetyltransferase-like isoleucine patch superfamily enzyme